MSFHIDEDIKKRVTTFMITLLINLSMLLRSDLNVVFKN